MKHDIINNKEINKCYENIFNYSVLEEAKGAFSGNHFVLNAVGFQFKYRGMTEKGGLASCFVRDKNDEK